MPGIEVNKIMTMDELQEQYPDMWAFYDIDKSSTSDNYDWDAKYYVMALCKFDDKGFFLKKYWAAGTHFNCMRTTENIIPYWGCTL